jgi:hypothetical protein
VTVDFPVAIPPVMAIPGIGQHVLMLLINTWRDRIAQKREGSRFVVWQIFM